VKVEEVRRQVLEGQDPQSPSPLRVRAGSQGQEPVRRPLRYLHPLLLLELRSPAYQLSPAEWAECSLPLGNHLTWIHLVILQVTNPHHRLIDPLLEFF
jgi:hypothetical protein